MAKVVITGGSGFLAGHLIRQLQLNASDVVAEIHTIDRRPQPSCLFDDYKCKIPIIHHCCDLNDRSSLEMAIEGAEALFHLARKQYEYLIPHDLESLETRYKQDNFDAVKTLIDAMLTRSVPNLIFVGDAYANLPCQDNFGISEEIHNSLPPSLMLGYYGRSRALGEIAAREKIGLHTADGRQLAGTFLRPTLIYGEGATKLTLSLRRVAESHGGCLPYSQGPSNGFLQYIYAGNLAVIMEENLRLLLTAPTRCSGELIYCMDQTQCFHFSKFAAMVLQCFGMEVAPSTSTAWNYTRRLWREHVASRPNTSEFSIRCYRFLFIYASGFSNRKQQLIFNFRGCDQQQLFQRYFDWIRKNLKNSSYKKQEPVVSVFPVEE